MMLRVAVTLGLSSVLVTAACGGAGMTAYSPVEVKTRFRDDQLFGAAERAIDKLGYQPVEKDAERFAVATREKEVGYSNVPRLFYRYSFRIEARGGKLSIAATCRQNTALERTSFSDCGSERPERVVTEQDALRDHILAIAKRLP